jgi:hypothetical protein
MGELWLPDLLQELLFQRCHLLLKRCEPSMNAGRSVLHEGFPTAPHGWWSAVPHGRTGL